MAFSRLRGVTARGYGRYALLLAVGLLLALIIVPSVMAKPKPSKVTLKSSAAIATAGDTVKLTADVRPVGGGTATLYRALKSDGTWVEVASKAVPASGKIDFSVVAMRHAYYKVKVTVGGLTLMSNIVWQRVRADLTVAAAPAMYQPGEGTPVAISGTLKPAANGDFVTIVISKWDDGVLVEVDKLMAELKPGVGDSSVYMVMWNAMQSGDYVIKAKVRKSADFFGTNVWTEISL